jgi:hypothetical protein
MKKLLQVSKVCLLVEKNKKTLSPAIISSSSSIFSHHMPIVYRNVATRFLLFLLPYHVLIVLQSLRF